MLAEANDRLLALRQLQLLGLKPENVMAANVVGRGTGPASNLLRLDQGATSRVKVGQRGGGAVGAGVRAGAGGQRGTGSRASCG